MKRKNLLKKILCGVLVAFVIFLACIWIIWKNEILSINSIKVVQEADEGHHDGYIYQMNYYGDYYFDEFIMISRNFE